MFTGVNRTLFNTKCDLLVQHSKLEQAIMATPTGDKRNLLTEANIHLLEAVNKINEAAAHV